jgi:DNA-directed RNA polymerase specialized sigma24 family protein
LTPGSPPSGASDEEESRSSGFWPETAHTLYSGLRDATPEARAEIHQHIMRVYRNSLLQFYTRVSRVGDARFPQLPDARRTDLQTHAQEVVDGYFAKRVGNLIAKWQAYRERNPEAPGRSLRVFIRQDFRYHCLEELRADRQRQERVESLPTELSIPDLDLTDPVRRELAQFELSALVRIAIERVMQTYPAEQREELGIIVEERMLQERTYASFSDRLGCSIQTARQRLLRFKERMSLVLLELIEEQGGSPADYMEDFQ